MSREHAFARALLAPDAPAPGGLTDGAGRPAGRRFDVYRNNVTVGLIEALRVSFPVIERLVGAEFFTDLARDFLRRHPPRSPLLMLYGQEMPGYLARLAPVAHLGYLPDVARLELALRHSYHAADAAGLPPEALAALPAAALPEARLRLAPSLGLVRSDWPVHGIWRFNRDPGAPQPQARPEDAIVTRPGLDPEVAAAAPGEGAFLAALIARAPLGAAHDAGLAEAPGFDLAAALARLWRARAITAVEAA